MKNVRVRRGCHLAHRGDTEEAERLALALKANLDAESAKIGGHTPTRGCY